MSDNRRMDQSLLETLDKSTRVIVDLLFTDLKIAFTFLETALASRIEDTQKRNVANALKAYRTVSEKVSTMQLPAAVHEALTGRLQELANRLRLFGVDITGSAK